VQERDRCLLRELDILRVIDREQAQVVMGFRSMRRTNRRLLALTRSGVLGRIFIANQRVGQKALYTASPQGAALAGIRLSGLPMRQSRFGASPFLLHRLAINEIYLSVKHKTLPRPDLSFARWISFREPLSQAIPLIPDGYFEIVDGPNNRAMFLEADLGTEGIPVWQKKTQLYLQLALSGAFPQMFRQPQFRVLVVVTTERRLRNIRAAIEKSTDKIFWFTTFDQIKQCGLWSPVWLRPIGEARLPLL